MHATSAGGGCGGASLEHHTQTHFVVRWRIQSVVSDSICGQTGKAWCFALVSDCAAAGAISGALSSWQRKGQHYCWWSIDWLLPVPSLLVPSLSLLVASQLILTLLIASNCCCSVLFCVWGGTIFTRLSSFSSLPQLTVAAGDDEKLSESDPFFCRSFTTAFFLLFCRTAGKLPPSARFCDLGWQGNLPCPVQSSGSQMTARRSMGAKFVHSGLLDWQL